MTNHWTAPTPQIRLITDTLIHRQQIQQHLHQITNILTKRGQTHDESKLTPEELNEYTKITPKLRKHKYGTPKYQTLSKQLKNALKHHHNKNPHHPEHYTNGIKDMTLIDLIEMIADWRAAYTRDHKTYNGFINHIKTKLLPQHNTPPTLRTTIINTINQLGWE